ncbi:MAG TPA: hypothetical protein DCR55_13745 [Lentisphaeria bacterium]|nr:hypothetical protein [Lentisphaeria bacterium]
MSSRIKLKVWWAGSSRTERVPRSNGFANLNGGFWGSSWSLTGLSLHPYTREPHLHSRARCRTTSTYKRAHQWFGAAANGEAWSLLEKAELAAEEADLLLRAAFASPTIGIRCALT